MRARDIERSEPTSITSPAPSPVPSNTSSPLHSPPPYSPQVSVDSATKFKTALEKV